MSHGGNQVILALLSLDMLWPARSEAKGPLDTRGAADVVSKLEAALATGKPLVVARSAARVTPVSRIDVPAPPCELGRPVWLRRGLRRVADRGVGMTTAVIIYDLIVGQTRALKLLQR